MPRAQAGRLADNVDTTRSSGGKIDFLMRITGTQNAVLAHALNFDASYISRIRAGKRGLPPKKPFLEPACDFFARHITEGYQRRAVAQELGLRHGWPADASTAAALLVAWLEGDSDQGDLQKDAPAATDSPASAQDTVPARLFFGDAGRREGVLALLSGLVERGYSGELLLQSDENMDWMRQEAFSAAWLELMGRLIGNGCVLRIVHTMSRDADEMWEGVRRWLPLYLSGAIQPYYYPRLRDGVRTRSLFVAPGTCALASNSIRGMEGDVLSVLLDDRRAVAALVREYNAYLELCRPLVETLDEQDGRAEAFLADAESVEEIAQLSTIVAVKDDSVLVLGSNAPRRAFIVREPRLVAALLEYLGNLPH